MKPRLVIRRDGPFDPIVPLLRRLRRRVPDVMLGVTHRNGRRSDSISPTKWCDEHGIAYREEAGLPPGAAAPDDAPSLELIVDVDGSGADLPGLRFVPDPFDASFDGAAASLLTNGPSQLILAMTEGRREADSLSVDLDARDTPRSVGIKARAACRDLAERMLGRAEDRRAQQDLGSGVRARAPHAGAGAPSTTVSASRIGRNLLARAALSSGFVSLRNWLERRSGHVPGVIANFHRVADDGIGHWMTLSTDEFATYVQFLKASYVVVSLAELRDRLATGVNDEPLVAITFDDGYRECLTCAAPVLEELGCPASFFVCSHYLDEDGDFEHDAQRGHFGLRKLNASEVRRLHELGFEIGSHSHTHMDFRSATEQAIASELSTSRRKLESAIGGEVRGFAVPYGSLKHCRPEVFTAARRAGYDYVLSHFDGRNRPGEDGFHLLRVRPNLEGLVSLHAAVEGWRGLSGLFSAPPDAQVPAAERPRP